MPSIRLFPSVLSNSDVGVSVKAYSGSREEGTGRVGVRKTLIKIYYVRWEGNLYSIIGEREFIMFFQISTVYWLKTKP